MSVAVIECAICQGTAVHDDYGVLSCGHCYHVACLHAWLGRGSSSCPTCRAQASKRSVRVLAGVEHRSAPDDAAAAGHAAAYARSGGDGDGSGAAAASLVYVQLQDKEQELEGMRALLADVESHAAAMEEGLSRTSSQLVDARGKLATCKARCAQLEAGRTQDARRLSAAVEELERWRERYRSDTARQQRTLLNEQALRRQAEADLKRLQLNNPALCLAGIQHLLPADEQQGQLASVLAARNKALQEAQARVAQLTQQLAAQQAAAQADADAAASRHKAAVARAIKDKDDAHKAVLRVEAANVKLEQDARQLSQRVQELQEVLAALQESEPRSRAPPLRTHHQQQQQQQQHWHVNSSTSHDLHPKRRPKQQQQTQQAMQQQQQQQTPEQSLVSADGSSVAASQPSPADASQPQSEQQRDMAEGAHWQLDAAGAVGPGSFMRQPLSTARAPSFMKHQAGRPASDAGCVTGAFLRTGPDGRGGVHLSAGARAGVAAKPSACPHKKARTGEPARVTGIKAYFK